MFCDSFFANPSQLLRGRFRSIYRWFCVFNNWTNVFWIRLWTFSSFLGSTDNKFWPPNSVWKQLYDPFLFIFFLIYSTFRQLRILSNSLWEGTMLPTWYLQYEYCSKYSSPSLHFHPLRQFLHSKIHFVHKIAGLGYRFFIELYKHYLLLKTLTSYFMLS